MTSDHLSTTFAALADPTRRAILERLANGEHSITELAEPFDMTLPAVSKHLRVLERAGLISRRREAQRHHCRMEAAPLRDIVDWAEHYRHLWDGRLDRLDQYLTQLTTKTQKENRHARPSRRKPR
jgi:DNA-binding transcriptional ArsR family regulator